MPRGQTAHLEVSKFKPLWNSKTKMVRLPACMEAELRAIAQWADSQPDPQAALQQLRQAIK